MTKPKMPEPVAWRSKYKSEPGMIGNYPWSYVEHSLRQPALNNYDIESLITTAQAEAYADARVKDAQQWISVEDRMPPEDDTLVLALHGGNEPEVVFGFLLHETLDTRAYTHWMPLPAPPTE